MNTYTIDADGNVVHNTQIVVDVPSKIKSVEQLNKQIDAFTKERDSIVTQLADIAEQIPDKAADIALVPDIAVLIANRKILPVT